MAEEGIRGGGRSHPRRRLTVAQAADVLGVSVDAVRARIKRETIEHVREGGRVYVILDADQGAASNDQGGDQGSDQDAFVGSDSRDELVEELRDRVRYLEEESRRKDHLLAAALERIPAIEAPQEASGAPESDAGAPYGTSRQEAEDSLQRSPRAPWWRRFFGFE